MLAPLLSIMLALLPEPQASAGAGYDAALARLRAATTAANVDPELGTPELREALAGLGEFTPTLADDPEGLELRLLAELTLARAALVRGAQLEAEQLADRVLSRLHASGELDSFDYTSFSPRVAELLRTRAPDSNIELAQLELGCARACRFFVDGAELEGSSTALSVSLLPGVHTIWLEGDANAGRLREQVELEPGQALRLQLEPSGESPLGPPAPRLPADSRDHGPASAPARAAPRAVEISLLTLGIGAAGVGAALWAIDDRCVGPGPRVGVGACASVHDTRDAGITALTLGLSSALSGAILLGVDARRRRRNEQRGALR